MRGIKDVIAIWQPHKYLRLLDNLESFKTCFEGVSKLIILPVWEPSSLKMDINLKDHFKKYNPVFANNIKEIKDQLTNGLVIGFGAGDITTQIRSAI